MKVKVIITGIGGQGTVSIGHLIGQTLNDKQINFVAAETHGMSQRGGSVIFHLNIGEQARSPLIEKRTADLIIAGEPMEAIRALEFLKPGGVVITGCNPVQSPVPRLLGMDYPNTADLMLKIREVASEVIEIDLNDVTEKLQHPKGANMILLGAALPWDILPVTYDEVKEFITNRWPQYAEKNLSALEWGKKVSETHSSTLTI